MIDCTPKRSSPTHVGQKGACSCDSLDYESRKWYFDKLKTDYEVLPDPYSVSDDQRVDELDVRKWPSVEFGDLYSLKRKVPTLRKA